MGREEDINSSNTVTIRELYTLIDSVKKDITITIQRLENKFDTMEAGRLTRLEREHADLKAELSSSQGQAKAAAFLIPLAVSIFFSIINFAIPFLKR